MSTDVQDGLRAALLSIEPYCAQGPNPINQVEIARWCDAFDDRNPIYKSVAPLVMLQSWVPVPYRPRPGCAPHWREKVRDLFIHQGYEGLIATNLDYEFERYLSLGEQISVTEQIVDLSDIKATALGDGYFLTSEHDYRDGSGEPVGRLRIRVLHFASVDKAPDDDRRAAVSSSDKQDPLVTDEWSIDITPTLVVTCALATNDFEPVHHDHALACEQGLRDIITNIPTTAGLIARCIGERFGKQAFIRRMSLRLGVPNFPGDRLRLSLRQGDREGDCIIKGMNGLGQHVDARVSLEGVRE